MNITEMTTHELMEQKVAIEDELLRRRHEKFEAVKTKILDALEMLNTSYAFYSDTAYGTMTYCDIIDVIDNIEPSDENYEDYL